MTQLLIQGSVILAQGPFTGIEDGSDSIQSVDAIFPKHVIDGWQIVDASVPSDFSPTCYTWDGMQAVEKMPITPAPEVPKAVTMRQARLALLSAGKLSAVDAAIASLPSPQKEEAQIEWDFSGAVKREWPLVQSLGALLGLSDADMDALFIRAATL